MYQFAIFDLDNTLLDFDQAEQVSLTTLLKRYHVPDLDHAVQVYRHYNDRVWREIEQGANRDQLLNRRFAITFHELGLAVDGVQAQRDYMTLLGQGTQTFPGVRQLLTNLKQAGVTLLIGTNGVRQTQLSRITGAHLRPYFEHIFISETVGHDKPDVRFFETIERAYPQMTPHNTVMIGDSLRSDITGGQRAHLSTIWYNPSATPHPAGAVEPTYTAVNFDQIQAFILGLPLM
ncbi:YjjG family noncanonical pyrimidine nucleotidase [Lactiplantibacillus modestisalitolerans]|uniref:YjjG family noncanonical pyrimidine nucleotidase n=1 Tax=Lactiplantibacillus modestisalitolerans TaxID=1457219 RepID=A0ABV5WR47_9LACO|nr:YjjG family noncanonical pyrimidine nucleotidase [Lactiplantibacillus modestisalitolerans]